MGTAYGTWSRHSCIVMAPSPITLPAGGPPMSRAVIYETFGDPGVLELREVPEPHAGPGEVRVRVAAAGLNPMDWGISSLPEAAARFGITVPSGFGSDFAGVCDEAGGGAPGFAVADPVYGVALGGAAADFVVVKTPADAPDALF